MPHDAERLMVALQLASVMAAMGAKLRPADFVAVFARPKPFAWGLLCQFIVAPLLAVVAIKIGIADERMALGLIVVASMPGGPMSTLFTHFGRGNAALAVSLTAVTTVLSVVVLPVTLPLLGGASLGEAALPANVILSETTLFLLLPLAGGAIVRRFVPSAAPHLAKWGVRLGATLLVCYVTLSLGSGRIRPGAFGWVPAVTIIIYCVVSLQVAMLPFRLFGWPPRDRLAVGIEMTIRDVNLALLLKTTFAPPAEFDRRGDPTLYGILFFAGTALVVAGGAATIFRFLLHPDRKSGAQHPPSPSERHPEPRP